MEGEQKCALLKICHTYPTMVKLGTVIPDLKKDKKKYMNHVTHFWSSAKISIFSSEINKFCSIKKYRYRLHFDTWFLIFLTFLVLSQATPGLLKIKVFWNKVYDVIVFVHDVTNNILSCHSNYNEMWSCDQRLVTSISVKEVIIISVL